MPDALTATDQKFSLSRLESLLIATFLILFFVTDGIVAFWLERLITGNKELKSVSSGFWYSVKIALPLLLAICTPVRSGLAIGNFRAHRWKVLLLMLGPIPFAILASLLLKDANPYPGWNLFWIAAIIPIREELIFTGFLYGFLKIRFPGSVKIGIQFDHALLITAFFFSMHHLTNYGSITNSWLLFQLVYTFIHVAIIGLTRQWTGSILYIWFFHAASNLIMGL